MKKIEFTVDFATKKKGDILNCDSMLANELVNNKRVAKYFTEKKVKENEK